VTGLSLASLVLAGVGTPAILFAILAIASLGKRPLPERWTGRLAASLMLLSCSALIIAIVVHGVTKTSSLTLSFGAWSTSGGQGLPIDFLVDRMSLTFAALSVAIAGVVSAFSNRYLHREPGYNRYFVLLAMFVTGMLLIALAGNVEVLFVGWELVGLSSALLVAFFQDRSAPVANALRVFSVYRISDAAMLSAAVLLRHVAGTDSLSLLFGGVRVPTVQLTGADATIIAILLIVAVAGKSALLPFSSWLPRAMEGPTPSSAVYYGSLSIHAGCFLLLRSGPLLEHAPIARFVAAGLGISTAVFAAVTTRVQSDIKSSLAYASLTQVGLIVVEISAGWYRVAFLHLAGHACFRLLQFLSAPNVLHDLHGMENAMGDQLPQSWDYFGRRMPDRLQTALFLFAIERGFQDTFLDKIVVDPFVRLARFLTRLDAWLCGAVLSIPQSVSTWSADDRDE